MQKLVLKSKHHHLVREKKTKRSSSEPAGRGVGLVQVQVEGLARARRDDITALRCSVGTSGRQ